MLGSHTVRSSQQYVPTSLCFESIVVVTLLFLHPLLLLAQNQDAISREVSMFNFGKQGLPTVGSEAISREVSVFNFGTQGFPIVGSGAISREVSVFNFGVQGLPVAGTEAISREVSVFNKGGPPVDFTIGSTNILGNQIGQVPLSLETFEVLTNLALTLRTDDSHIQILGITPASSEVLAVTLGPPGANSHPISFMLNPAAIPPTNHTLAYLNFQGITNQGTAIVPLTVSNLFCGGTNGQIVPARATGGHVIVVVNNPVLFAEAKTPFAFTLFGIPGETYSIQATTNLAPAAWIEVQRLTESGLTLTITDLTTSASQQFYRAQQVGQ